MSVLLMASRKLRLLRLRSGMLQREVAEAAGISLPVYNFLECGSRIAAVKVLVLENVVGAMGMTLPEFFMWQPSKAEFDAYKIDGPANLRNLRRVKRRETRTSDYPTPTSSLGWNV